MYSGARYVALWVSWFFVVFFFFGLFVWFFSSPEPKARVSYCHSAPSVVRPSVRPSSSSSSSSVRKLFTFSTSSPKPLDGFWWNLVGMKYSWSLTSVVVFRPDPPLGGSRAGQNRSQGGPLLQETSSSATNWMDSNDLEACGKKCCYFLFHSEVKFLTRFWRLFGLRHFALFSCNFYGFLCGKVFNLHLFCVISMFVSGRMII